MCDERLAFGKEAQAGALPFAVSDDGIGVRAPIAGLVAGLRAASADVVLVLPVDCPLLEADDLSALAAACRDAAVPQTGPLPGAYRRSALPALEQALAAGRLAIREAIAGLDVAVVAARPREARERQHAGRPRGALRRPTRLSRTSGRSRILSSTLPAEQPGRKEHGMAGGLARRRGGGIGVGGGVVIAGVVIALFWSFWIGLIIVLHRPRAFGGFVRGKWY